MPRTITIIGSIIVMVILVISCQLPTSSEELGTLNITIGDGNASTRSILPEKDMEISSYELIIEDPEGKNYEYTDLTDGDVLSFEGPTGYWQLELEAQNAEGELIGQDKRSIILDPGEIADIFMIIRPLYGEGDLILELQWNESLISDPNISAYLYNDYMEEGYALPEFDVSTTDGITTATAVVFDLDAGYYFLNLSVNDDESKAFGALETVRIVANETTRGSITITEENLLDSTGEMNITIIDGMNNPVPIAISNVREERTYFLDETIEILAAVAYDGYLEYRVYIDGREWMRKEWDWDQTSVNIRLYPKWQIGVGNHRIDIVFTNGQMMSSTSIDITIIDYLLKAVQAENETVSYSTERGDFEITPIFIDEMDVKFNVNGEITDLLELGEIYELASGEVIEGVYTMDSDDGGDDIVEFILWERHWDE